jgi:hypothetical protein
MRAVLMTPWKREAVLEVSATDGLRGSLPDIKRLRLRRRRPCPTARQTALA